MKDRPETLSRLELEFIYQKISQMNKTLTIILFGVRNKADDVIDSIYSILTPSKYLSNIYRSKKLAWPNIEVAFSPFSVKLSYLALRCALQHFAVVIAVIIVIAALKSPRYHYIHVTLDLRAIRQVSLLFKCVEALTSRRTSSFGIKRTLHEANRHRYHVIRMNMYAAV